MVYFLFKCSVCISSLRLHTVRNMPGILGVVIKKTVCSMSLPNWAHASKAQDFTLGLFWAHTGTIIRSWWSNIGLLPGPQWLLQMPAGAYNNVHSYSSLPTLCTHNTLYQCFSFNGQRSEGHRQDTMLQKRPRRYTVKLYWDNCIDLQAALSPAMVVVNETTSEDLPFVRISEYHLKYLSVVLQTARD